MEEAEEQDLEVSAEEEQSDESEEYDTETEFMTE